MKNLLFILFLSTTSIGFANTNSFKIMLDEFTLRQSNESINDTIEVTRAAWLASDSIHVSVFISEGSSQKGRMCSFIARDTNQLLFEETYVNNHLGYRFSFATNRIDPNVIKMVSMSIGAAKSENKWGWKYRMGTLKFI